MGKVNFKGSEIPFGDQRHHLVVNTNDLYAAIAVLDKHVPEVFDGQSVDYNVYSIAHGSQQLSAISSACEDFNFGMGEWTPLTEAGIRFVPAYIEEPDTLRARFRQNIRLYMQPDLEDNSFFGHLKSAVLPCDQALRASTCCNVSQIRQRALEYLVVDENLPLWTSIFSPGKVRKMDISE